MGFCYRKSAEDLDMGERHWANLFAFSGEAQCAEVPLSVSQQNAQYFSITTNQVYLVSVEFNNLG